MAVRTYVHKFPTGGSVIEAALRTSNNPDETEQSYKDRLLYRKEYNGNILEVVTVKEGANLIVITEYILEKL